MMILSYVFHRPLNAFFGYNLELLKTRKQFYGRCCNDAFEDWNVSKKRFEWKERFLFLRMLPKWEWVVSRQDRHDREREREKKGIKWYSVKCRIKWLFPPFSPKMSSMLCLLHFSLVFETYILSRYKKKRSEIKGKENEMGRKRAMKERKLERAKEKNVPNLKEREERKDILY